MTDERGGYGVILSVLVDGPDFQKLSADAQHAFLVLKVTTGATGIWVEYADALVSRLARQTDRSQSAINDVLAELRDAGWIDWERNVAWVVGQLRHHPHIKPTNAKHRKAVYKRVAGLPRLAIVRRFVETYSEYLSDWYDELLDALPVDGEREEDEGRGPIATVEQAELIGEGFGVSARTNGPADGSLRAADELAYEIGRFCVDNDCDWRLKTAIDEWARTLRGEPKYAGLDHAYEVRKANEWHQNKTRGKIRAPDQSIRNWLEKAIEIRNERGGRKRTTDEQDHDPGKSDTGWRG